MKALFVSLVPDLYGILFIGAVYVLVSWILPRFLEKREAVSKVKDTVSHAGH